MAKKSALFLAGIALAGCLVCSFPIVQNTGDFEPLKTKQFRGNPEYYDGYNFFGDCTVEATTRIYIPDNDPLEVIDYDFGLRYAFGDWTPNWNRGYTDIDEMYLGTTTESDEPEYEFSVDSTYLGTVEIADPYYLAKYRREFYVFQYWEDDQDYYDFNPNKWRVYQSTPVIVPRAFLESFLLGLSLQTQGDLAGFEGTLRIYDFIQHRFSNLPLSLRSGDEIPYNPMNSISPSVLNSYLSDVSGGIFRYVYFDDDNDLSADPLYYNGGWVMCSFELAWLCDDTEVSRLLYTNEFAVGDVFRVYNSASPHQLASDTLNLWQRFYGETVYLEPINPPDIIFGTVEGFLSTDFIPGFSFGDLLLIVLGVMVFGAFLKVFLGG